MSNIKRTTIATMLVTLLLLVGLISTARTADDQVGKVLECMRKNVPNELRAQDVEFTTADKAGTASTLKGRLFAAREQTPDGSRHVRAMLMVSSPPNLAGAAYLVREKDGDAKDGMYVYLPSVRRVRRVTGSIADGGLMGTSFSYADFKQIQNTFTGAQTAYESAGEVDQRAVHVLTFKPTEAGAGGYSLVRSWVDQKTCVPLKAEFYENRTVRKRLVTPASSLKQVGDFWYPAIIEMHDLSDGLRTTLKVKAVTPDPEPGLSAGTFDPKTFFQR
ncbi:MAG: outer rane lipoproteinsorting protein [Panacagrimonas sp.]|jgi:outer membrane lipoprotein-sorting protein|nr:outer membrane lipoprotein-sorting protein [Panacagrimonas sp.]MCC2656935.1 outer rane lipoproteinsorting protein [Panacagrimonas sp.]